MICLFTFYLAMWEGETIAKLFTCQSRNQSLQYNHFGKLHGSFLKSYKYSNHMVQPLHS